MTTSRNRIEPLHATASPPGQAFHLAASGVYAAPAMSRYGASLIQADGLALKRRIFLYRLGAIVVSVSRGTGFASIATSAAAATQQDTLLTPEEQEWVHAHPVLIFAPERDFPPFSFIDAQGRHQGLSADVLDLMSRRTGLKFRAVAAADRAENLERVKRRDVDLLTSLRPTAGREAFLSFTSAYVSSPTVVLRRRGDRRSGELTRMAGEHLAVERGSATEDFIRASSPGVALVEVDTPAQGLRDLVVGEVDACVVNLATASYIIERDRIGGLRVAGDTGYFSTLTLGYRKDWPLLGRVLEKGMAQITDGERDAMMARWIPLLDIAWWQRPEVQRVLGVAATGVGALMGGLLLWNRTLRRTVAQRTEALRAELAQSRNLETQLRTLAEHDSMTGLLNRASFTKALGRSLSNAALRHWSIAVVFIDLDKFKAVNDTLGHSAGDELLRQIASRLKACMHASDLIGRLGGDEFIAVAEALHDCPGEAIEFADRLLMQMKQPFILNGQEYAAGFSAGIAIFPGDGDTAEALIANADSAMYEAKRNGRFRAAVFRRDAPALSAEATISTGRVERRSETRLDAASTSSADASEAGAD